MGYKLRRWLADRLPAGLSSGERMVALEIADQAREDSRVAYGPKFMETVVRRTGLSSWKQVGKVLGKLAAAGIELRQPILDADGNPITDKAGRTMFACSGHQTTFRVPTESECPALKLPPSGDLQTQESSLDGETNTQGSSPAQGTKDPESSPDGETNAPERSPAGGHKVPRPGGPTTQTTEVTTTTSATGKPDAAADSDDGLFAESTPAAPAAKPRSPGKPAERKPNRHQVADDLTAAFWERHGKGRAQSFIAIRGVVRTAIGNSVDRDDCARALDLVAREGRSISGATLDIALGKIRGQQRRGPFQNPQDHDVYDEDLI